MMADEVYANGMEVSCKAGSTKSIAAFPDVCFTPPQTPPTPMGVPIPYPNTGVDSDTSDGSTSVKISGEEVMLKSKSFFKTSSGDEAGSTPKKGMINSKISGKVYFTAWSMDVMFEGENAVRHLDLTTHNHGSTMNAAAPWPALSKMTRAKGKKLKPCDAACRSKKISKRSKDKLRDTKEYKAAKVKVNKKPPKSSPHKITPCPTCGKRKKKSPDHMVPLSHIRTMPGFACVKPKKKQSEIANHSDNMVPLCASCNQSKRDKMWPEWKGVKSKGYVWSKEMRDTAAKRSRAVKRRTQARINAANGKKCG